ncbi:hypothetical protein FN846DRAFT_944621 [Sphaerosporella brunnea]|uniref:Uncharacterized protein n=1 Tax=Sphaerosporella brunnea TaxID=1250544 RepID=A0A5J5F037_9PEZI|nr:hypothetical protein FN846DRAFT_944621 [Sphaerosporella brunnea]
MFLHVVFPHMFPMFPHRLKRQLHALYLAVGRSVCASLQVATSGISCSAGRVCKRTLQPASSRAALVGCCSRPRQRTADRVGSNEKCAAVGARGGGGAGAGLVWPLTQRGRHKDPAVPPLPFSLFFFRSSSATSKSLYSPSQAVELSLPPCFLFLFIF